MKKIKTQRRKKTNGHMPFSLESRIQLCQTKAEGFRIMQRALKSARLTEEEAEKVNHCLAAP